MGVSSRQQDRERSEALRAEVKGTGVHVMTVYPGLSDTPMAAAGLLSYERRGLTKLIPLGNPASVARALRRAIERRSARLVYPRLYTLARWFPRIATWLSVRFTPKLRAAT